MKVLGDIVGTLIGGLIIIGLNLLLVLVFHGGTLRSCRKPDQSEDEDAE